MGNLFDTNLCCRDVAEEQGMLSSESLINFVSNAIKTLSEKQKYQNISFEIQQLSQYIAIYNKGAFRKMLSNDRYLSLYHKSKSNSITLQHNENIGQISMNESITLLNDYNISSLQFQRLYDIMNSVDYQQIIAFGDNILKNSQFDSGKPIIEQRKLWILFQRIFDEQSIFRQLINYWIKTIKSVNLHFILELVARTAKELYNMPDNVQIPERICEILLIWMVQVVVFNISNAAKFEQKITHILDLIFYHKCPIEKLMILYAQDQLLRKQYVIRDQDDQANRLNEVLEKYKRNSLIYNEIQLIKEYVSENWFITLYHQLKVWEVVAKRFHV